MRFWNPRNFTMMVLVLGIILSSSLFSAGAQAQSSLLYFPYTGHHLSDTYGFLSFWREHNGEQILGYPVTEELVYEGYQAQYFTKGRLETVYNEESEQYQVRVGTVAGEYAERLFRQFPDAPKRRSSSNELVFERTKHTLRAPFLSFWQDNGGEDVFGAPISESIWEQTAKGQRQVQYFERARLERNPTVRDPKQAIEISELGLALALMNQLDTSAIANRGGEVTGPPAPQNSTSNNGALIKPTATPSPTPIPPTATPVPQPTAAPKPKATAVPASSTTSNSVRKYIHVNLSKQWLYAYENGVLVFDAPVATGRDGMNTPTGVYSVYHKIKLQTMRGVDNGVPWVVPDVPDVMYIVGGVAIHGTYWHNLFGTGARPSHGCINLPLASATWLYNWAPYGTTVEVTY